MFGLFSGKVASRLPFNQVDETLVRVCKRVVRSAVPDETPRTAGPALQTKADQAVICFVEHASERQVQELVKGMQSSVGGVVVLHRQDRLYAEINRYLAGFPVGKRHHHITAANAHSSLYRALVALWKHHRLQEQPSFFIDTMQQQLDRLQGQASVVVVVAMERDERQQLVTTRQSLIWRVGDTSSVQGKITFFDANQCLTTQAEGASKAFA